MFKVFIAICLTTILSACVGLPDKVVPVKQFDVTRYLGKWYEVARLDHSFERGLSNVSAEYSVRDDGGIRVINKGYSAKNEQWNIAEGKAYFVREEDEGYLKVSFFGPFYGSYIIFELDHEGYQYAFVSGPNYDYLWLLSRSPKLPQVVIDQFIEKSALLGFNTNELIFVSHSENNND